MSCVSLRITDIGVYCKKARRAPLRTPQGLQGCKPCFSIPNFPFTSLIFSVYSQMSQLWNTYSRKNDLARPLSSNEDCKKSSEYLERKAEGADTVTVAKKLQQEQPK